MLHDQPACSAPCPPIAASTPCLLNASLTAPPPTSLWSTHKNQHNSWPIPKPLIPLKKESNKKWLSYTGEVTSLYDHELRPKHGNKLFNLQLKRAWWLPSKLHFPTENAFISKLPHCIKQKCRQNCKKFFPHIFRQPRGLWFNASFDPLLCGVNRPTIS